MQGRWSRRRVLQTLVGVAPLLAGCTVSGSVQQQQQEALANATPTATVGASPTAVASAGATPSTTAGPLPTYTPGGKVALRLGAAGSPAELDAFTASAAAYSKANSPTVVTVERLPGNGVSTLNAALAANTAPDLVTVPWDQLAVWSSNGGLDDLTALVGANKLDLSSDYSLLQNFCTIGGRTAALPLSYNPRVLFVNLNLLTSASITVPDTGFDWAGFEAAATKLTGSSSAGFVTSADPFDWFPWVWAAGGSVFDDDLAPTTCTLADTPSVSGLQRFADLWLQHRGAEAPGTTTFGASPLESFLSGKVGMVTGDRSTLSNLTPATFKWQVTYLPQGPGGHATTYAATFVGVSKSSRQPLVAGAFAGYLATDKTPQGLLAKTGVVVPALRAAAESSAFAFTGAKINDAVFTNTLLFAYQPPRTAAWPAAQSAWNPDLQKLWAGQQSAADAAKALAPKVNAALKSVAATPTVQPFAIQPPTPTPAPTATSVPPPTAAPKPNATATPKR